MIEAIADGKKAAVAIDCYLCGVELPPDALSPEALPRAKKRIRRLTDCRIPAARLRKGTNVLAVAIHRAPTPCSFYASRHKGCGALHADNYWAKIGLFEVRLTAPPGAAAS